MPKDYPYFKVKLIFFKFYKFLSYEKDTFLKSNIPYLNYGYIGFKD